MNGSSKTSNATTNVTSTVDERVLAEGGSTVQRADGGVLINNTLDGGAIDFAATVSERAFEAAEGLSDNAFRSVDDLADNAFQYAGNIADNANDLSRTSLDFTRRSLEASNAAFQGFADKSRSDQAQFFDQLITYGIPAIAIIFIAWSMNK